MSVASPIASPAAGRPLHPAMLVAAFGLCALALSVWSLDRLLAPGLWWAALTAPDPWDTAQWTVRYSFLPRLSASILAGAALSLAAAIFQQVLRNPIAEPTTLGVSAGASLALTAATLFFPGLLGFGREAVALCGAAVATAIVLALAWNRALSPLSLILAGLIVGLYAGAVSAVLSVSRYEALSSVFIWSTGILNQGDWLAVLYLLPRLLAGFALALLMARPLAILALDDESGRSLGLSRHLMRFLALLLAVGLSASVVAAVGVIGFVGLAAPALAKLFGARAIGQRLVWAPLVGGSLLWLADQAAQALPLSQQLPTGVATALLGAPILIWMLPRLQGAMPPPRPDAARSAPRPARPWLAVGVLALILLLALWPAIDFGQGPYGWEWLSADGRAELARWRAPRVVASIGAGAMLAMAGVLMQRLTGNPMASPEVLGISSGAAGAVIVLALLAPAPAHALKVLAAAAGALAMLMVMLSVSRKAAFSPDRMLLAGIAVGTAFGALTSVLMASGDPRLNGLLAWMAGSTYLVTMGDALIGLAIAASLLAVIPFFSRWLVILPLGDEVSRAVGVPLRRSRLRLLLLAAILTGAATLIVGPLSFVGLMAPHMARMMGLRRPAQQLFGAALLGALIMLLADWLGRNLMSPYQIPAGLIATFVGGPYFMWLMWRRPG